MTARAVQTAIWAPGLAVALGAAVATAHGLFQVALAARVPAPIAWLYPLITDGLALVAYAATARLTGSAARYAWTVVVLAAGLSGLAQASYLAADRLDAAPALRFGVGAWPALAAAIVAHLLYLLAADAPSTGRPTVHAEQPLNTQPPQPAEEAQPSDVAAESPTAEQPGGRPLDTPTRSHARAVALRHAARHGELPSVSQLAAAAQVSRGTASTVLKPLRIRPLPLHLIPADPDDDAIEEHPRP